MIHKMNIIIVLITYTYPCFTKDCMTNRSMMISVRMNTVVEFVSLQTAMRNKINARRIPIATQEKLIKNCDTRVFSSSSKMGGASNRRNCSSMMLIIYQTLQDGYASKRRRGFGTHTKFRDIDRRRSTADCLFKERCTI